MTVTSIRDAWAEVQKIFPTRYEHDASRSERAGYPIYYSTSADVNAWISDLGNRLEVNLPDGKNVDIWIQAPAEATTSDGTENTEDTGSATREERRETAKRIHKMTSSVWCGPCRRPCGTANRFSIHCNHFARCSKTLMQHFQNGCSNLFSVYHAQNSTKSRLGWDFFDFKCFLQKIFFAFRIDHQLLQRVQPT